MNNGEFGTSLARLESLAAQLGSNHREDIPADYWHGYLTAIALSPTALAENEWMAMVLGREMSVETAELEEELRAILGGIIDAIKDMSFKPYFPGDRSHWQSCNTHNWCEGFLTASHSWPEDLQQKAGEELVGLTLPVVIFYNPAEYFEEHGSHTSELEQEEILDQTYNFFSNGLYEIPRLWDEVLQIVDDEE